MVPPEKGFITWIRHSLMISNDHIFRHAGLDALAIVMLVEMSLQLFFFFMVTNITILTFGFQRLSMNTICYGSTLLWGHWTLATLMVFAIMYLVHNQWHEFSKYRRRYLIELRDAATPDPKKKSISTISVLALHGRAVVVRGLPAWMNQAKDPDQELFDFFERLFPGKVDSAAVARNPGKELVELIGERDEIAKRYEIAMSTRRICLKDEKDEAVYVPPMSLKEIANKAKALKEKISLPGKSVEQDDDEDEDEDEDEEPPKEKTMTEGILQEMNEIEEKIAKIDTDVRSFDVYQENTGYVVFLTAVGRSLAVQTLLTTPWENVVEDGMVKFRTAPKITVIPAPEPRDIVHDNVGLPSYAHYTCGISPRVVIMRVLSFLLLIFWAIPVALITSLTQLDTLEMYLPFIKPLTSIGTIRSFLSGFLPTVALVQFMARLPKLFAYMAKLEGTQSWTEIDASATSRYVWFQIFNVLFVCALTGDIVQRLSDILAQPASLIDLLGTAIPGMYMFFTSYIMLLAFSVFPLELAQISPLIMKKFFMKRSKTKRLWNIASAAPLITGGYAKQYGYILLAFAISLEFATVAPLLLPFGVLFFGFGYVILRHHVYYLYGTSYEGMGKIWPWLMFSICIITMICQLTLIGIFYGRKSPIQATLTWPMVFVLLIFYYVEEKKHAATFHTLSMQELKKSENTFTRKLKVLVRSNGYVWLISNDVVNKRNDRRRLKVGIPIEGLTAAEIYLHPIILRHRLGKLKMIDDDDERMQNEQMMDDTTKNEPVAYLHDVLQMTKIADVQIFGKTFHAGNTFMAKKGLLNVASREEGTWDMKEVSEEEDKDDNDLEVVEMVHVKLGSKKEEEQQKVSWSSETKVNTPKGKRSSSIMHAVTIGANRINLEDSTIRGTVLGAEEIPGGIPLCKSRWILWLSSQVLAVGFIVAIFLFAAGNSSMSTPCESTLLG